MTSERSALMHSVCNSPGHFTPLDLRRKLASDGRPMALTTIYRNLPLLERAGLILRTTLTEEAANGATTYEHVSGRPHHDHLVCERCGRTIEFEYDAIEVLQERVAGRHGFRLVSHHLELVGVCPDCLSADRPADGGAA